MEILGINARTDSERAYYADLDAQQEFEKTAKLLAFNTAYDQAAQSLKEKLRLPILRPFENQKYSPYQYEPIEIQPKDRFQLWIRDKDDVKPILSYFLKKMSSLTNVTLQVSFIDSPASKKDIEIWSQTQNIPPEWVLKKRITFNATRDDYSPLSKKNPKTPLLILIRDGKQYEINTSSF